MKSDSNDNLRYEVIQKASLVSIIINIVLSIGKLIAGIISGSTAVLSDAVHSFSDVITTLIVMLGLKFSSQVADKEHPYGHQRIESLVSLLLAFTLVVVALYLGYEGVVNVIKQKQIQPSWLALSVTIISIVANEWMFQYKKRIGTQYQSSSMLADAWHHRSDSISSIAVLVGVIGVFFGTWVLDPIATLFVCVIILKAAYDIGLNASQQLIDQCASDEICAQITAITLAVDGVRNIDLLRTRMSNYLIFVELEIAVDAHLSVKEGHDIAQMVHHDLMQSTLSIGDCMIHIHPYPI